MSSNLHSELASLLSHLPSRYSTELFTLVTYLPPGQAITLARFFITIFNYLPVHLPRVFTAPYLENCVLPYYFTTVATELMNTLNTMHSVVITITHFSMPSTHLSSEFSNLLDILHNELFTNAGNEIPTLFIWLRTSMSPVSLTQPSSVLDNLITQMLDNWLSDLSALLSNLMDALDTLPEVQYNDPLLDLIVLIINLNLYIGAYQQWNIAHSNPAARSYDLDALTLKYVHEAKGDGDSDPDECQICLQEMKDGDNARRLGCLHAFHMDCIDRWLEEKATCPLCRTHINNTH